MEHTQDLGILCLILKRKKGNMTQSYDKTPYTNSKFENQIRKIRKTKGQHTNVTKNFDYTTIAY